MVVVADQSSCKSVALWSGGGGAAVGRNCGWACCFWSSSPVLAPRRSILGTEDGIDNFESDADCLLRTAAARGGG